MVKSVFDMLVAVSSFRDLVPPFHVFSLCFSNRRIPALNTGLNNPNFKKFWTLGAHIPQLVLTGMNPTTYKLHWNFEGGKHVWRCF